MMNTVPIEQFAVLLGVGPALIVALIIVVSVWRLVWKAWALWLAARRSHKWWFIALLVINTVGILEILYIFLVAKQKDTK